MKNLIITVGIIIVMMMELYFQADCQELIRLKRQLKWLGEEIGWSAALQRWDRGEDSGDESRDGKEIEKTGKKEVESRSFQEVVTEILTKNLDLDENLEPVGERGMLQEKVRCFIDMTYPEVTVTIDGGLARTRLSFLSGHVRIRQTARIVFTPSPAS